MFTCLLFQALRLARKLSYTRHFTTKPKAPLLPALLERPFHTGSSETESEVQILVF